MNSGGGMNSGAGMKTVAFTEMSHGTCAEYQFLHGLERQYVAALPDRLLASLRGLDEGLDGYRVTRLEHSLQTATRARDDGADVELVVAALVHDIGDGLAPDNHSQMAAAIIRPYVREEVTWVVSMHGIFQMRYYGHHVGLDPNERDAYADHIWYASCDRFCDRWDQASFDPDFPTLPLEAFEADLRQVFTRPPFDTQVIAGAAPA